MPAANGKQGRKAMMGEANVRKISFTAQP